MSANNQLVIHKKGKKYVVKNTDVDTGMGFDIGEAPTLEYAIKLANTYMHKHIIEYGLKIKI